MSKTDSPETPETRPPGADKSKDSAGKSKEKIQAAWISFVGRIVAQVVGAVASVTLGILILQRYQQSSTAPVQQPDPPAASKIARTADRPADGGIALAVLPLESFSPDSRDEYFADGMTEALIADLAQIDGLRVISRTSTMRYKTTKMSVPEIASELAVDMIVEGSVVKVGDRVRVTAQLVDARRDEHVWARSYERTLRDVLTLQGEVAAAIAQEVKGALTPGQQGRLTVRRAVDPAVYDLYLRGRHAWNLRTSESLQDAVRYFEDAVSRDVEFALAYAGLGDAYMLLGLPPFNVPDTMVKARKAAERALALDDALAEAHTSLAVVHHRYEWDWEAAEREFRRALELNPGYITGHQWYSYLLAHQGRDAEAVQQAEQALKLDPFSWVMHQTLGMTHYFGRRFDTAAAAERRALEIVPTAALARIYLARVLLAQGRPDQAIEVCEGAASPRPADLDALLAVAYVRSGNRARAEAIVQRLIGQRPQPLAALARWHAASGDRRAAIDVLERSLAERADVITSLKVEPLFDGLQGDPQFAVILRRLGLGS